MERLSIKFLIAVAFLFLLAACNSSESLENDSVDDSWIEDVEASEKLFIRTVEWLDYETFLELLAENGFHNKEMLMPPGDYSYLSVNHKRIILDYYFNEIITVYEYASNEEMEDDSKHISKSGSTISYPGVETSIGWASNPYFFKRDLLIVLYVGENEHYIKFLKEIFGEKFAGSVIYEERAEEKKPQRAEQEFKDDGYVFNKTTNVNVGDRSFLLEDNAENIAEDIVVRDFLYTITAEFDKKYDILADIETHRISIENEKKKFEEGIYTQSYIIHKITTLTKKQYARREAAAGVDNPLYYYGLPELVNKYMLVEYKVVNVDFTVKLSAKWIEMGPQYGEGTFNRSFIVGKSADDKSYKIYDYGFM